MSQNDRNEAIQPAAFKPPRGGGGGGARRPGILPLAVAGAFLLFAVCAWFLVTAQSIKLTFQPQPDSVSLSGGLSLPFGQRRLLRPGQYTVSARKNGYQPFTQTIEVTADSQGNFAFELVKLPGRLRIVSTPAGGTVSVDGEQRGSTPLEAIKLAPGEHTVTVRAKRYQVAQQTIDIEGRDKLQTLDLELTPAWAPVSFTSNPDAATVLINGQPRGSTPATVEIGAGEHEVTLRLDGYQDWQRALTVVANEPRTLPTVELEKALGRLRVTSEPVSASVSVDQQYRGRTPVTLELQPGRNATVKISRAGYESATRQTSAASGEVKQLSVSLKPILGEVRVEAEPAGAKVYVDGRERGPVNQTLSLTATEHEISIRRAGYVSHETTVTPNPAYAQTVRATLQTEAQARAASLASAVETSAGQRLVLVRPGRFTMGAPRREQGRQANEVERRVRLTRAYYIGVHEVTNEQYRTFRKRHSSGIVARTTLDNDNYPVARVSWSDAVAYCNWLSSRDGLTPAYQGGELVTPVNTGYRLPTEAEWAYAARFAGGRDLKYPWGARMPPTGAAGNFADQSASSLIADHLQSYDDGYRAAAPVGRFAANALGIFDLGGNVSEWVHDRYSTGLQSAGQTATDPLGPSSGSARVVRGSSWRHGRITELRLSYRSSASTARDDLGFRIARYARAE